MTGGDDKTLTEQEARFTEPDEPASRQEAVDRNPPEPVGADMQEAVRTAEADDAGFGDAASAEWDEADETPWGEDVEAYLATLKERLAPLCEIKSAELPLWGYERVEADEIWELVAEEARKSGALHLHQMANAILSLKPNQLMNHLMKALYRR
ncbi:MAG: post-transcriptional regulator [Bacillota bacterium]